PRVARAIQLKWPNDLLIGTAKLAGILLESLLQGSELSAVVVGVGLNVHAREFPAGLALPATSLALCGSTELEHERLLVDILAALERRLFAFERDGVAGLLPELKQCDALLERKVRVETIAGTARGIDDAGQLVIEDAAGALHHVASGSVEWLDR
ncbi:MAG TPA: biotin--[acetyl-CoA-carboxylase] ligase, partial [Polyangiaceae bacterium]